MKRIFKVFALVTVFCFLLSACSSGNNYEKNILGKWSLDEESKGYYDLTFLMMVLAYIVIIQEVAVIGQL